MTKFRYYYTSRSVNDKDYGPLDTAGNFVDYFEEPMVTLQRIKKE